MAPSTSAMSRATAVRAAALVIERRFAARAMRQLEDGGTQRAETPTGPRC
jgi:hypothetical protein